MNPRSLDLSAATYSNGWTHWHVTHHGDPVVFADEFCAHPKVQLQVRDGDTLTVDFPDRKHQADYRVCRHDDGARYLKVKAGTWMVYQPRVLTEEERDARLREMVPEIEL